LDDVSEFRFSQAPRLWRGEIEILKANNMRRPGGYNFKTCLYNSLLVEKRIVGERYFPSRIHLIVRLLVRWMIISSGSKKGRAECPPL
jgi:hypothetical protein